MMLPILNLISAAFFFAGGNGSTPKKQPLRDQKAAENCFKYDCKSHPLLMVLMGFEPATTALNAE